MQGFLGNPPLAWVMGLGTASLTMASLLGARKILVDRLSTLAARTATHLDDLAVNLIANTRAFALAAVSLYAGSRFLSIPAGVEAILIRVMMILALLQANLWAIAAVSFQLGRTVQVRLEGGAGGATAIRLLGFGVKIILWAGFFLVSLENLGVNVTSLVTGLGIGGLAVALALQNILGDLIASLTIVLDRPFAIGDFLIVGDFLGVVEHIGLKSTRMRSLSGEQIIFPNGDLLKSRIRNFKAMRERRVAFTFGITYQASHAKLMALGPKVQAIVACHPGARCDRVHFKELGASALIFEVVYFLEDPDFNHYMDVQQAINLELLQLIAMEGLEFAYPTQTLFLAGRAGA